MMTYFLGGMLVGVILMWLLTFLDNKFSNDSGVAAMSESYMFNDGNYYSKTFYFGDVEIDEDDDCVETEEEANDC